MRVVTWIFLAPFVAWAVLRVAGVEPYWRWVPMVAFTPYVAAASALPLLVAGLVRRRAAIAAALVTAAVLAWCVVPRTLPEANPPARGGTLRVLSSNLMVGSADATELVALVRRLRPDVLTLQEFTPESRDRLEAAGLRTLLPHVVDRSAPSARGSGIYARDPLVEGSMIELGRFRQVSAVVRGVEVVSVHPCAPRFDRRIPCWEQGLRALPRADRTVVRVLAGDFNATLDHWPMRDLLAGGYRDAADVTGQGFVATWPQRGWGRIPGVTIDHVLADSRVAIRSYGVQPLAGTDHRPVFAELELP